MNIDISTLDLVNLGGLTVRRDDAHFVALGDTLADYQGKVREASYKYVACWDVAIDVGGHIGIFSCDFARRFSRVYSFEPMPFNRACLERNVPANVVVHPYGLGDRPGITEMRYNWKNSGGSEVIDPLRLDALPGDGAPAQLDPRKIVVEIKTLDSLAIERVGLIKIDVQGMEEQVLKGARETLLRWRPVVILEEKVVKTRPYDRRAIEAAAAVINSCGYYRAEMIGQDAIYTATARDT